MDYFNHSRRGAGSPNQNRPNANLPQTPGTPGGRPQRPGGPLEALRAPSSIRIRRLPSSTGTLRPATHEGPGPVAVSSTDAPSFNRRRSSSEPHRFGPTLEPPTVDLARQRTAEEPHMATLAEEPASATPYATPYARRSEMSSHDFADGVETPGPDDANSVTAESANRILTGASAMQGAGNAARSNRGLHQVRTAPSHRGRNEQPLHSEYHSDVVDLLDLVDPEVRTLGTLTNVQNSLFVPDLGRLINRRPTYNLSSRPTSAASVEKIGRARAGTGAAKPTDLRTIPQEPQSDLEGTQGGIEMQPRRRRFSISSDLSDSRYAVLPHGISLEDWSEDDKAELDDHVRHLMHSKREGFKRTMRGFRQYISKPLGLFVFVYATLVTLFGAAWVFFLIGWISIGQKQQYIENVVDNILVALFALMGDGLAPFRAVDTYHMCFIARYHHLTWRLRKERDLPELVDHNDLPLRRPDNNMDLEDQIDKEETAEFSVLKPLQQRRLQYHQAKFSKAHTFYRPHETPTHHAFPLNLLVAVVVLLDFHSFFQMALGTCTWSWNYKTRPQALTATILACSLSCNITAGILISVGDHRTRKKDVLERIERQNLTQEALERMAKSRQSEEKIAKKSVEVGRAVQQRDRVHMDLEEANAGQNLAPTSPQGEEVE